MRTRTNTGAHSRYRIVGCTLVVDLGGVRRVLSSAPKGGGPGRARYILNHQVETHPVSDRFVRPQRWPDPARSLVRLAASLGVNAEFVGLMTAVPMKQLVTARARSGPVWVECFATVGVTNAVRAGEWPDESIARTNDSTVGTINLVLVTNACLSASAMVGAVQVATESKVGVLRDQQVPSWTGKPGATGTGTDAVVIACRLRGQGPPHRYSGTHTMLGAMIGRVVADCVTRGLAREQRRKQSQRSLDT